MPPDMNKLPTPGVDLEDKSEKKDDVKELLQIKDSKNSKTNESKSDLLNNMKKKIQ